MTNDHAISDAPAPEPPGQPAGMPHKRTVEWLRVVRNEYLEVPGLNLTKPQVRRMWSLDAAQCDAILDALTDARFLKRTPAGAYVRADGAVR